MQMKTGNSMIKIFDKTTADALSELGFLYCTEKINNNIVYCFQYDADIVDLLQTHYEKAFVLDNTLSF